MEADSNSDEEQPKQDKRRAIEQVPKELVEKWTNEQLEWSKKLQLCDTEPWQTNRSVYEGENSDSSMSYQNERLRYVAGLDISFVKGRTTACSGLFVFDLADDMRLVYEDLDTQLITMDVPYVPGFLAYREAPFLLDKLKKLKTEKPHLYPHCIFIDGNGVLHTHKFGMACHIGFHSDTPTIGVSKKLYQVHGLENNDEHKSRIKNELKKAGDYFELKSKTDTNESLLAMCYRSTNDSTNPIYVSIGNKIGWQTCLWILKLVISKYRIPEPIRKADFLTREFLRNHK